MAELEELVLSGKLFREGGSRPSSPTRSRSPSPDNSDWPELETSSQYDSDRERSKAIDRILNKPQQESIGVGVTGRTGVKGVIRDRAEHDRTSRDAKSREIEELNKKMEKAALSARTFREEEEERILEKALLEGDLSAVRGENRGFFGGKQPGTFGHLREVGVQGFVPAIEQEERNVWVVIHIYAPSLDRCYALDEKLAQLARTYPQTKFLRCRAGALGFASSRKTASSNLIKRATRPIREEDEDDPYADLGGAGDAEDGDLEDDEDHNVDLDMLPTLLVYRGGELVFNWVRVDWEAGRNGIEDWLVKHHVVPGLSFSSGNCGFPSDDEGDLLGD